MKQTFNQFQGMTLDDFQLINESHQVAVDIVSKYLGGIEEARARGKGLTILGPSGVGKTMLASIVLNTVEQWGHRIEAIELPEYVDMHKNQMSLAQLTKTNDELNDEYDQVRSHLRYIKGFAEWVLFDDVGREYEAESGWAEGQFFNTLRFRYDRGLPTVITTNLTMGEIEHRYSESFASMLAESSDLVVLEGDDYRCRRAN